MELLCHLQQTAGARGLLTETILENVTQPAEVWIGSYFKLLVPGLNIVFAESLPECLFSPFILILTKAKYAVQVEFSLPAVFADQEEFRILA